MKIRVLFIPALISVIFVSCSKEFECSDAEIQTSFIAFAISDIDTFILKKYKPNDNYQNLIDTFKVTDGYTGQYFFSNDTTTVVVRDGVNGIRAGFDWQIFIPAKNKTIFISEIFSEKKTGKCNSGIFSLDKFGCSCINQVFSAKKDNQLITFQNSDTARNTIYIRD